MHIYICILSDHNAVICDLTILPQYKRIPKRTTFMYNKENLNFIRTETKHLSEIYYKRNNDIYKGEDNSLFIQTSIDNLMQQLVPSRVNNGKFHLLWITKDVNENEIKK